MAELDESPINENGRKESKRFPCSSCGAKLEFKPGSLSLNCGHCGHETPIPQSEDDIKELDFEHYLSELANETEQSVEQTAKCSACAAEVTIPERLSSFDCPFCGSSVVVKGGSTRKLITPQSLLPFKIKRRAAMEHYAKWLEGLWFAPSELTERARTEDKFMGTYLPYWTYDAFTTTWYHGQRGVHYMVPETYTTTDANGNQQTHTRMVQRTNWYPVSGTVMRDFDDVLVPSSKALKPKHLEELEPWDLENLIPFEESYLAGFKAETYQVDLSAGFKRASQIMEVQIRSDVTRDIGGDVQTISSLKTEHAELSFKHVLLPTWISAFRYGDKIFRIIVNGRTGEVQGERPYSALKIAMVVIAVLIVIGGIIYLANQP